MHQSKGLHPIKRQKKVLNEEHTTKLINTKDLEIKSLERNNSNLSDAVVKKQEQLPKQANIIGELREKINRQEIQTDVKDADKVNDTNT